MTTKEDPVALREAVEAQAQALVEGDLAMFASYALPQALLSMYRSPVRERIRSFEMLHVEIEGELGKSDVAYRGASRFVLRSSWLITDAGWKASAIDVSEEPNPESFLRRVTGFGRSATPVPQREDLS